MAGHELLDLAQGLAARLAQPRALGRRRRRTNQLANRRERQLAGVERGTQRRQIGERSRDPQPMLRRPRRMAEHPFEVVHHRHHAERFPDLEPLGVTQPARLVGIERGAPPCDPAQSPIDLAPTPIAARVPHSRLRGVSIPNSSRSITQHRPRSCSARSLLPREFRRRRAAPCVQIRVSSAKKPPRAANRAPCARRRGSPRSCSTFETSAPRARDSRSRTIVGPTIDVCFFLERTPDRCALRDAAAGARIHNRSSNRFIGRCDRRVTSRPVRTLRGYERRTAERGPMSPRSGAASRTRSASGRSREHRSQSRVDEAVARAHDRQAGMRKLWPSLPEPRT